MTTQTTQTENSQLQTTAPQLAPKSNIELGLIAQVKNLCEYAIKASTTPLHACNYDAADKVLLTAFSLVKLCYAAGNTTDIEAKKEIRSRIETEMQFLCMLVIFAFGVSLFGLSLQTTQKFNCGFLPFVLNILTNQLAFYNALFYQLQDTFLMSCNFLAKTV